MKQTQDLSRRRGICVMAAWVCGVLAALTGAMWIAGNLATPSIGAGGVCVFVSPSQLQVAVANQPVIRRAEGWFFPRAMAGVIMSGSIVRPSTSTASMTVSTQSGAVVAISLRVVSVPLWQMLAVLLIVGGGALRISRRMFPGGHCSTCGYDLQGLEPGKCPECGDGFVASVTAAVRRMINSQSRAWMVRV
ncbi:MAG: hypothetical protein IT432_02740 [Phycisphaerales bacterium]|nr:hypothetical protein [Phycisphaerales bacterium]